MYRSIWFFIVLIATGCSSPELEPLDTGSRILAFGDSLTLGVGGRKERSYPAMLSQLTGLEVINSGVSGETTDDGLLRFEQELEQVQPSLVILIEGGNDILQNRKSKVTKSNLAAMISLSRTRKIPVILIGVPEKRLFSNSAPLYEELANETGVIFDGTLLAGLLRTPAYKSDPIHLNEQGYRAMAEAIYALLQTHGAI